MGHRRFLFGLCLSGMLLLPIALLSFLVDPSGTWAARWPGKPQLCAPAIRVPPRHVWGALLKSYRPDEVLLGTSRVLNGYSADATHGLLGGHSLNLGLGGAHLAEIEQLLDLAIESNSLRRAWIGLDFGMFAKSKDGDPQAIQSSGWLDAVQTGLGSESMFATLQTLAVPGLCDAVPVDLKGFPADEAILESIRKIGWAAYVRNSRMAMSARFSASARIAPAERMRHSDEQWRILERIVRAASRADVDLVLMINPSHREYVEAIVKAGLSDEYGLWRSQLAEFSSASSIPLFDWSELSLTTDADIDRCDPTQDNSCPLFDLNHARPMVGAELLRRMLESLPQSQSADRKHTEDQ